MVLRFYLLWERKQLAEPKLLLDFQFQKWNDTR